MAVDALLLPPHQIPMFVVSDQTVMYSAVVPPTAGIGAPPEKARTSTKFETPVIPCGTCFEVAFGRVPKFTIFRYIFRPSIQILPVSVSDVL